MMIRRTIAFLVASTVVGGLMLVGCGDDTTNNSTGTPPTPLELTELSSTMATAFCNLAFSCCTPMEQVEYFKNFASVPKTAEECLPLIQMQFETFIIKDLTDAVNAGRLKFDGIAAKTCLAQIENKCEALDQGGPFQDAACSTVFIGLAAEGEVCAQSIECAAAGSICNLPQDADLGKCQLLPKEGAACVNFQCATGLACANQVCVKPVADGEACKSSNECVSEYCDFNTSKCGQKKALGTACLASYECKDGYCETQMKVCTALKAAGQTCTSFDECQSFNCVMGSNVCGAGVPECNGI